MPDQAKQVLRTVIRNPLVAKMKKAIKGVFTGLDPMPWDKKGHFKSENAKLCLEGASGILP